MCLAENHLYEFGSFSLDPSHRLLLRCGVRIPVSPKAFDLLVVLVEHQGELLARDTLLDQVWHDSPVEEGNLSVGICQLRKALGDDLGHHEFIETLSKRGYRFVSPVSIRSLPANALAPGQLERSDAGKPDDSLEPAQLAAAAAGVENASRINNRFIVIQALALGILTVVALAVNHRVSSTLNQTPSGKDAGPVTSLAVLPFVTVGLTDTVGMGSTDALITRLAYIPNLHVRATSAIERYRNLSLSPQAVGRELGVDVVLTGGIDRQGDQVRLTVQMIRVRDGNQLWSEEFREDYTDVFALEDKVSDQADHAIRAHLFGERATAFPVRSAQKTEADEAYLKGRYFWNKRTAESVQKGLRYFREAIRLDPEFSEAYQGVADSYAILGLYSVIAPDVAYPAARDAAQKSLQLNNRLAGAHATLGLINLYYDWDGQRAQEEFTRAIKADPTCAIAHSWSGENLAAMGRFTEAISEAKLAVDNDPTSPIINTNTGWTLYLAGHYDQATELLTKAIELDPSFPRAHFRLGVLYEKRGRYDEAIAELNKAVQLSGGDDYYESALGHAYAASGQTLAARQILNNLARQSRRRYVPGFAIATIYAGLNETGAAFEWLERAVNDHSTSMVYLKVDPALSQLRSDSRFADVARHLPF